MAKKKRKKTKISPQKKAAAPAKKKKTLAVAKNALIKGQNPAVKTVADENKIKLNEKIELEKSSHSYKSFFHRRYGKYFKIVKKPARIILKIALIFFGSIFLFLAALFLIYGRDLPDVSQLKTMNFSETTRIYDREGNILYSIFDEENRKYVPLNYIAPLAIDATLSIEDKNFYNHWGFDPLGMIRAEMKNVQQDTISQGASTITQQLAKNIFLSPERTYERKIKELLLALQIEWMYTKDEILEMYLNKISYGSNAFGIEAAAETYFGKNAGNLSLVESAVLASLPKAPSYYSPYGQNKDELIGYCGSKDTTPQTMEAVDEEALLNDETQQQPPKTADESPAPAPANLKIVAKSTVWAQVRVDGKIQQFTMKANEEKNIAFSDNIQLYLGNADADVGLNGNPVTGLVARRLYTYRAKDLASNISAEANGQSQETLAVEANTQPVCNSPYDSNYIWGRKDYVLERMMEDRYITKEQFNEAWQQGFKLKFKDPVHKIEAPHFVFYVKQLLEQKYGKELVESGGLEVKTSLDPKLQSIAEEAVAAHAPNNLRAYGADNAAMVALDPKTGQVLAMVGSVDYWDPKIDGQVNVTTSPRQPGSSFKPLVYALAMKKAGLGSGTILSDYKTIFNNKDVPHDADNTYKGKMTIRTALSNSRNIPAIKAYYLAGEEEELLNFLDKLGLTGLRKFRDDFNKDAATRGWTFYYGWPMAIGSGEVPLIDLAGAYGALANEGKFMPVNPILEVRDRKGEILEKFEPHEGDQVIDPQVAYVISSILSDVLAKPAGEWRNSMTISGHTVAAKTGTSNKKIGRSIYPNNNLMIGYTPSIVAAVWIGNTDGGRMWGNAWAFADAGPIWKQFLTAVLKDKPDEPFPQPAGLKWIGKEVYPSFADFKTNFDKRFKRLDETQQTQTQGDIPESSLVSVGGQITLPINSEPRSGIVAVPAPSL